MIVKFIISDCSFKKKLMLKIKGINGIVVKFLLKWELVLNFLKILS